MAISSFNFLHQTNKLQQKMKVFLLIFLVAIVTYGQAEFQCDDGETFSDNWQCDDYCDCQMCEDEAECEDGYGISKFKLGDLKVKLNYQQEAIQTAVLTEDLPSRIWNPLAELWECITTGWCNYW